ncbi:terminase small subunit [Alkalihalophilus marmarensis]|uniref:terminase small subunit n=1 Tax=Alkalihalophilus marmarensis TaxID=521377 RepID=UPI002E1B55CD|nr:terminase small subunit [Alkalihalophilus marmarensis]MED1602613.1 terminase small subunit [Alkalihalophilus marmarensis]
MARQRDPRRDEAYNIWKKSNGSKPLKDIAEELECSPSQIRKWKSQDKWEQTKGNVTNPKSSVTKHKKVQDKEDKPVFVESEGLTDKQRLFCIYYVKSFNATQSAIKAGYSPDTAHVQGPRLLGNVRVGEEIRRIKSEMMQGVFIDATDVLNKYIQIAFADISDYATFGRKEIIVDKDEEGNDITTEVNYVDFKESTHVDGTIITEVKQGRDGVSVKLADKMKALEMLTKYFELLPEYHKRKLEEEKLKVGIEKTKAETEKLAGNDDEGPIEIVIKRKGERS